MKEIEIILEKEYGEKEITLENEGSIIYPSLENLEVNPTNEQQVFNHENSYGYDKVTVNAIETDQLDITPTKEEQNFSGIYDNVKVNAVTSEIDENITPDNIKLGVDVLGVTGTFAGEKYAPKYIRFSEYNSGDLSYELSQLDTKNLTTTKRMFDKCYNMNPIDVSNFDTSNVTNMEGMFANCNNTRIINVNGFDTSNVTTMASMFGSCRSVIELDLSSFNTSKVKTMESMFSSCVALTTVDISNFDTSNVESFSSMFYSASALTRLDLKNFTSPNATVLSQMFRQCSKLEYLDIRNMTLDKVTSSYNMFAYCSVLMYLDIRGFDFANATKLNNYSTMFTNVPANCEIIVKDDAARNWVLTQRSDFTNIKTVAELTE